MNRPFNRRTFLKGAAGLAGAAVTIPILRPFAGLFAQTITPVGMKVLIQWSRKDPTDWVEINALDWASTPKREEPSAGTIGGQDNEEGWVFDVNVQGVHFAGSDHVAIEVPEDMPEGCIVYCWNDDPEDFRPGTRSGQRWTFLPPAPDRRLGNRMNTRQTREVWAEDTEIWPNAMPWEDFPKPHDAITRHGVWLTDEDADRHLSLQSPAPWRDWA